MTNEKENRNETVALTKDELIYYELNAQCIGMNKLTIAILQYVRRNGVTSEIDFFNWLNELDFAELAKKSIVEV